MKAKTARSMSRSTLAVDAAGTVGTALALAPLLLALQPRADHVAFTPERGSSVEKEFGIQFDLALGDLTLLAGGMDMSESVPADFEITTDMTMNVVDTYVEVEDGVPLELIRLYDALEARWETPDDSGEMDDGSFAELVGKSVRFKWNPDAETYDRSFHESEGDEDALENLGVDMDFRAMLPEGEVSEGDTWTLEPEQVAALILFGTQMDELSMDMDGDMAEMAPLFESELFPQLEALAEGLTAECTYKGRRDVDGASMGAIDVALEGEGEIDLAGLIRGMLESQVPEGIEIDLDIDEAVVSLSLEGKGTLLWDLEAGHFHSFELAPELEILVDVVMTIDAGGETQDLEASVELMGSGTWSATTE